MWWCKSSLLIISNSGYEYCQQSPPQRWICRSRRIQLLFRTLSAPYFRDNTPTIFVCCSDYSSILLSAINTVSFLYYHSPDILRVELVFVASILLFFISDVRWPVIPWEHTWKVFYPTSQQLEVIIRRFHEIMILYW